MNLSRSLLSSLVALSLMSRSTRINVQEENISMACKDVVIIRTIFVIHFVP